MATKQAVTAAQMVSMVGMALIAESRLMVVSSPLGQRSVLKARYLVLRLHPCAPRGGGTDGRRIESLDYERSIPPVKGYANDQLGVCLS